jgi:hypothetical protein
MDDITALKTSNAGMRLIAMTTILNRGDFERLRQYIADNYQAGVLAETPVSMRLAEFKAVYRIAGKLRVAQVIAADKHQVIAAMEAEHGHQFVARVTVEVDYPHKVLDYSLQAIEQNHSDTLDTES